MNRSEHLHVCGDTCAVVVFNFCGFLCTARMHHRCITVLMRDLQLVSDWVEIVYSFDKRLLFSPLPVLSQRLIELHPVRSEHTDSAEPLI